MTKHVVAPASSLAPGGRLVVEIGRRRIVLFNLDGEFFGLNAHCPHQGGDLAQGRLTGLVEAGEAPGCYRYSRAGEILRCPWHGWEFDIRTGRSRCDPSRYRAMAYAVSVEAGRDLFDGPYQAERVAVSVEDEYLVVEL